MHDAIIGERLGLPAVAVMTTQFVSAGELMARVLGAANYEFVVIEHPISSAPSAELVTRAGIAVEHSARILLAG